MIQQPVISSEVEKSQYHTTQELERFRNSDESLQQRLDNSNGLLAAALELIGVMQPVCSAADQFFNQLGEGKPTELASLGKAVANYRDYIAQHATHHHVPSQRPGHDALHGQTTAA